ncbi:hypothetical protein [Empedobacter sp.]|uniref:hypothetical protein n=1 Tax=Empedobacter sp. TaxID=1927715 RepID=UPI0028A8A477|nr:hypothetical protein [Empedobacter sp.]
MEINISDIILKDKYAHAFMKEKLSDHITTIFDYTSIRHSEINLIDKDFKFSDKLYWECITDIYDTNPIDASLDDYFYEIESDLYSKLVDQLGEYFNIKDPYIMKTLGFTISNFIDNLKYKDILKEYNPFKLTNEILFKKGILYMLTENVDESYIRRSNYKESELIKNLEIGVISKCKKDDISVRYIKDNFGYRAVLLNLLKDNNNNRSNPIKKHEIIKLFRNLGVDELSLKDSEINNWIIRPLKTSLKIGSNNSGYFVINDLEDLHTSYMSHYQNYLGFKATLDKHKMLAEYIKEDISEFEYHIFKSNDELL